MIRHFKTNTVGPVRREMYHGREHLVAPVVAIFEAVLNGEFVPEDEIAASVQGWNGRPVVIRHPQDSGGNYISANAPQTLQTAVGTIFNAEMGDDGRLRFETWIDLTTAAQSEEAAELVSRLEAGVLVEGSTGYHRAIEAAAGEFRGLAYQSISRDIMPDHYAFLLDELGACSVADGCGGPRVNRRLATNMEMPNSIFISLALRAQDAAALALAPAQLPEGSEVMPAGELHLTLAHLGSVEEARFDELTLLRDVGNFAGGLPVMRLNVGGAGVFNPTPERPSRALYAQVDAPGLTSLREALVRWVEMPPVEAAVSRRHGFTPHITLAYVPSEGELVIPNVSSQEIVVDAISVNWGGRVTRFMLNGEAISVNTAGALQTPLAQKLAQKEQNIMQRDEMITALIAHQRCRLSEATVRNLPDADLQALLEQVSETPAGNPEPAPVVETAPEPAAPPPGDDRLARLEQAVETLTGSVRSVVDSLQANVDREKNELVQVLLSTNCELEEGELKKLGVNSLQKLAAKFAPVNYAGLGHHLAANSGDWVAYDAIQTDKEVTQ